MLRLNFRSAGVRFAHFLLLVGSCAAVLAQSSPAPSTPEPLVLRSTTRLVQVNVIVQGKKGEPVTDLKTEDFTIIDGGKSQEIKQFSMESSDRTLPTSDPLPPNVYTNELTQRSGVPASVTMILLDNLNTKFTDQAYAKQQVIQFLRQIEPADRIALYTLGRGLRVLHDYTTDSSQLLRKLSAYRGENLPDVAASEPSSFGGDSLELDAWLGGRGGGPIADFYTTNRVLGTLRTLEFVANHVSRLPGRKNLIWVSGGFPLFIGLDNPAAWRDPSRDMRTFSDDVDRTVRALNNANLAIYPVDARGLMVDPRFSAERRSVDLRNPAPLRAISKGQDTMKELAARTGGRAYYNTNDLKSAIRDAVADARVTYTLGYYPSDEKFDGKFHDIKVKVNRPGVNVRYRKGYYDSPQQPQDEKRRKLELRDAVWSPLDATGMGLVVQVTPSEQQSDPLKLVVKINPKDLHLEELDGKYAGRLDVLFVQKDERGKEYSGVDDTINMRLEPATYQKVSAEGIVYTKQVARAAPATQLRVVVRDAASGAIGSVSVPLAKLPRFANR